MLAAGRLAHHVLCALCGLALTLALPPTGWWPLVFVLAPRFGVVARAERRRHALAAGFWFGLPFFAVYVLWLPRSFAVLFGPAFWFVFPVMVGLLALFWGLTCLGAWLLAGGRRGAPPGGRVLLTLPVLWVLVEWARTQGYFAFPWGTLGYAWLDSAPGHLAEHVGVYGLSLLATLGAALLAWPFASGGQASRHPGSNGSDVNGSDVNSPDVNGPSTATGANAAPSRTARGRLADAGLALLALVAVLGLAFWQGASLLPRASVDAGAVAQVTAEAPPASPMRRALLVQGNVDRSPAPPRRPPSSRSTWNSRGRRPRQRSSTWSCGRRAPSSVTAWTLATRVACAPSSPPPRPALTS